MKDNLARTIYAEKIATEIADHYTSEKQLVCDNKKKEQENIVFAISGKWGEGKTALLKLLEGPLTKKGFKVIWFNPWKYSQEDITLKRAFLGILKAQLGSSVDLDDLYYDRTKTTINFDWRLVIRWSLIGLFFYLIILPVLFGLSVFELLNDIFVQLIDLPLVKPLLTLILIPIVLEIITISRRGANVSTAEEFEGKFINLIGDREKIVVFVDDLDRCTPKTVKVILDSLRTFFQHPECSYIITGDHTVVERYAGDELELPEDTSQQQKLQEGRRFLKKLFDVYWRLPLPTPYQFSIFAEDEIKISKIKLEGEQLQNLKAFVIDDGLFERNPRHVKRFLTKLRFALEGVSLQIQELEERKDKTQDNGDAKLALGDILDSPDLLSKILLIEEFFYPVYERLILNPEDLVHHEKNLRNNLEASELAVGSKKVLELLDNKLEELNKYVSLVRKIPKFTDENNSTIHEVANFLSFSGSTGLPSTLGPDEANFEQYLKSGQLIDKLGKILEVSKADKRELFVKKTVEIFTEATDVEKTNVLSETLKLSAKFDEWSNQLPKWKINLYSLLPDKQEILMRDFWVAVLQRFPSLIATVKFEKPLSVISLWIIVDSMDEKLFHKDTQVELENIVKNDLTICPPALNSVEIFLKKFGGATLNTDIDSQLTSPDVCKIFIDELRRLNFEEGILFEIVKKKLRVLTTDFTWIDWVITNKEYLKTLDLFELTKSNIKKWIKDIKQLIRISEIKDSFEISVENKKVITSEILAHIKKSADIVFLDNPNIQSMLDKEDKKVCFENLKEVLSGKIESMDKRKQAADFLMKNKNIWNNVEYNDVYGFLKEINGFKFGKITDLKDKPKEILDSWGFNDSSDK